MATPTPTRIELVTIESSAILEKIDTMLADFKKQHLSNAGIKPILTRIEAAAAINISPTLLDRETAKGTFRYHKVADKKLYFFDELKEDIKSL